MKSIALYIHIPWCVRKCPYCDFNSHKSPQHLEESLYIDALLADMKLDIAQFDKKEISSIFIGGGTPSLFSAASYERLFAGLGQMLHLPKDMEITLEANPGSFEQQRFNDYRVAGINRLSIGIQSFNPQKLKALGRIHDAQQAHSAVATAKKAGFDNINLDIMHGLPEQTLEEGLQDIETAIALDVAHISWYQLTIEPNTVFYKKPPRLPSENICYELEEEGFLRLEQSGYTRYEISAFCQNNKRCTHNINYWSFGDYYGIGAGAHGKISTANGIFRTRKHRLPAEYLNADKPFSAEIKKLSSEDISFEYMLNVTRLEQAIAYQLFEQRTGLNHHLLQAKLAMAETKGFIQSNHNQWQITALGRRFTNDLQSLFLTD